MSLLGPLQVDGVGLLSPRDRVVLSALAVRSGDVLSAEQLADALWGGLPPPSWPKVVQGCVARLRRALGHDAVQTTSGGYRLTLSDDEIDVRRFEALVARGRSLSAAGEHDRAAAVLGSALGLWRGQALPDLEGWPDGRTEAVRLDELRLGAQELQLAQRAAAGHDIVADATAQVAAQPMRETRWHLLALSLYRSGRQADALAALRRARRVLQDELGLDPGEPLVELERAILTHDTALAAPAVAAPPDLGVCPYQGLLVYDRGDADRFFGRDDEVAACVRVLRYSSLLVVAGPSGSGKSSLVRAGVIPRLERSGHQVVVITPGAEPGAALAGAVSAPGRDLVVVVDQLEELFTGGRDTDVVRGFLDGVAALVGSGRSALLVVRADQVGGFTLSAAMARLVERGLYLVTSMSSQDLSAAIEGPARQAGLRIEAGLVDLLVREVEGEVGALPLLSHALAETWERREAGVLTVEGYRASGGIRGAVAQSAERMWASLPREQQITVRALLLRLVTLTAGGEPAAARLTLASFRGDAEREQALDLLARCRLVTTDWATATVAHEAVVRAWPRLRSWLDDDAAGQATLRHLTVATEDWQLRGRPDSELYRGARLASTLDWRRSAAPVLTAGEADFLDAAESFAKAQAEQAASLVRQQVRQNRRLRTALAGTAVALVLALIASLAAVNQGRMSSRTARAALVDQLIAQSFALRATRRDVSALLAVQAYRLTQSAATRGALFGVFTAAPGLSGFGYATSAADRVPLTSGTITPDGSTLLAVGVDGIARVLDLESGATRTRFPAPDLPPVSALIDLSRDGSVLAEVSWEGPAAGGGRATLTVFDAVTRRRLVPDVRLPMNVGAVAVSPNARFVAVSGYRDGVVLVYDVQGRTRLPELVNVTATAPGVHVLAPIGSAPVPYDGERNTAALTFRSDGLLLVGSEVGVLRVVDPGTGREVRRLAGAPDLTSNNAIALSDDESVLVSSGTAGVVRWDLTTGRPVWTSDVGESRCRAVAVVRTAVMCGGRFGTVEALALTSGNPTGIHYDMQHGAVSALLMTPDQDTLIELSDTQPVVARWQLDGSGPVTRRLGAAGNPVGYDAGGRLLLVRGPDRYISSGGSSYNRPPMTVIAARTAAVVDRLGRDRVAPVWTQQPGRLVAWTEDGEANVFDVVTGRKVRGFYSGLGGPPLGTATAAHGSRLLAWSEEVHPVWRTWDVRTGEIVSTHEEPSSGDGALGPGGRVVLWSGAGQVSTYDADSAGPLASRQLAVAALSPRGLVVGSRSDGRLGFYRPRNLHTVGRPVPGTPGVVQQFAFSRDGRLLAARGRDGSVRLVDLAARIQLGEPISIDSSGDPSIALRPDGLRLTQPSRRGILEWDLRPSRWQRAACQFAGRELTHEEWRTYLSPLGAYRTVCR